MLLDESITVKGNKCISLLDFSKRFENLSTVAVLNAIKRDDLDGVMPVRDVFVVLNKKAQAYKPRRYGARQPIE